MIYSNIQKATFISRPNRFIAEIITDGKRQICHVKNTGRLSELLLPGCEIYVQKCDDEKRKTKYDLIAVRCADEIINIDSQVPNRVFFEWVKRGGYFKNLTLIKPECKFANSRFDFYLEADGRKIFAEIKGVTLKQGEIALFPDAPTERGVKHLEELIKCCDEGYEAYVFFIIKMKGIKCFSPNKQTHPEFADALKNAVEHGVNVCCVDCVVTENSIEADSFIEYRL